MRSSPWGGRIRRGRLLVIGDIHGCAADLRCLLDDVAPEAGDRVVFLGDYIDRGPASAEVIDEVLAVRQACPDTICLRGNHEEMLLGYLGLDGSRGSIFLRAGGAATVSSYGLDPAKVTPEALAAELPEAHLRFFRDELLFSHLEGPFLFVHAGVRPRIPISSQDREDLLWIREEFLSTDHGLEEVVVFGHTPQRRVQLSASRRIAMDSGAVYGGHLSCLDLTRGILHEVPHDSGGAWRCDTIRELRRAGVPDDWALGTRR